MLWTAGRRDEAVTWWRGAAPDERDNYARVMRDLRGAIADGAHVSNTSRIDQLLRDEERRWRERAGARLDYFGTSANRF
jgi:hypothetical protein